MPFQFDFILIIVIILIYRNKAEILYEGSACTTHNSTPGICRKLPECPEAFLAFKKNPYHNFVRCNFINFTEIVCCPANPEPRQASDRPSLKACRNFYKNFEEHLIPLITGGENAKIEDYPFMASLGLYDPQNQIYHFECGATLISERFLVTAAHCIFNTFQENVTIVRMGVTNLVFNITTIDEKIDYKVKNLFIHKNYKRRAELNDVGLVEIEKSVTFGYEMKPACLLTSMENYPTEYYIVGWGVNGRDGSRKSVLQRAFVHYYPHKNCSERYKKYDRVLESNQLCAYDQNSDICVGDSGGPLISRRSHIPVLVGISSFGESGCFPGRPSVYTNIYDHLDFIENIVWSSGTI